jgi:hypothetical protein
MRYATKYGSNWAATASCYKRRLKRSVHSHVFTQPPPVRRPNDKYPVSSSHCSNVRKNVSLQCYLVATVIHIQSVCSRYVCICSRVLYGIETAVGAESFLRSWPVLRKSKNPPHFIEPEGLLPSLQVPATCPYSEPYQSSPFTPPPLHSHFLKIHLNYHPIYACVFQAVSVPQVSPLIPCTHLSSPPYVQSMYSS